MTDAAIEALGALAGQLPWVQYEQLLNQWLKVMKKTATKVQVELPLLCMLSYVAFAYLLLAYFLNSPCQQQPLDQRVQSIPDLAAERYMAC